MVAIRVLQMLCVTIQFPFFTLAFYKSNELLEIEISPCKELIACPTITNVHIRLQFEQQTTN